MEPIRVAQVIGKLSAGGVESVVYNYYRNIDHTKIQFDFFVDEDSSCEPLQEIIDMGARYYVIPPYQKLPQYMCALIKLFKENKYQIVHSNMNTLSVFSLCAAWIAGVPVRICHNHSTASKGETVRNLLKNLLKPFAKVFATDYCACSYYAGEWLFGEKTSQKGMVTVFNNAIDIEKFKYNEEKREELRKELGIQEKYVVGHIGRFCFQKNQEFVIEVFEEIYKKRKDAVLLMVGIGEQLNFIEKMVQDKGLTDYVRFLGVRNDVNDLCQAMDVLIFPSRYEGLGLVAIEAQTASLPVVASTVVPIETKVTTYIEYLSLDEKPSRWAERVLAKENMLRIDSCEEIKLHGYDIKEEAGKLEMFYYNCIN